ncbi:MAG: hypothetical protein FJZ01_18215 [Candidatus Sericytochromatia bacterium]|nr:hypothetical protein [Candidatus Tanganyikabacteria bacterium]
MLEKAKPEPELSAAMPWLAWIERTLGTRVQMVCWSRGVGPDAIADPAVLGAPRLPWSPTVAAIAAEYRRSRPPEVVAAGSPHLIGQALRFQIGGVPALVRVGSDTHPLGVILVGPRACAYTAEELGLVAVAAQRIADAIAREALQELIHAEEQQRLRATYQRDSLIDFSRGLPRAGSAEEVCRHLVLFGLGLTTATGGYVAFGIGREQPRIAAVRGHVLVARPADVAAAIDEGRPVFPAGAIVVPFRSAHISGYLVLGGRLSGEEYSAEDATQLEAACSQAAIALELHSMASG